MHSTSGQAAIRVRGALARGDARAAAALVPVLDEDHRIEILLGAALRDARENFAGTGLYLAAAATRRLDPPVWLPLCRHLGSPPDTSIDEIAVAWAAAGLVPEFWRPVGRELTPLEAIELRSSDQPDNVVCRLARDGVGGEAILPVFREHRLFPAVSAYYRGGIRAMGWRPLLFLGIVGAQAP